MRYITDPDFLEWARPLIMARNNYSESEKGRHRSIMDSVERLLEQRLISERDIEGALFRWEKGMRKNVFGRCGQTKIASISDKLDSLSVQDGFVDGIVYHQCLHLRQLNECRWIRHDKKFRQLMTLFPDSGMMYDARSGDYRPIHNPLDSGAVRPRHVIRPLEYYRL